MKRVELSGEEEGGGGGGGKSKTREREREGGRGREVLAERGTADAVRRHTREGGRDSSGKGRE